MTQQELINHIKMKMIKEKVFAYDPKTDKRQKLYTQGMINAYQQICELLENFQITNIVKSCNNCQGENEDAERKE